MMTNNIYISTPFQTGGTCPTPVELCEGQSCPADMQCVRSGPTAPSVCQCQPERLDDCAGVFWHACSLHNFCLSDLV